MHVYASVAVEVASHPSTKEVEFALLDMDPLSRALQENARCWVTSLGKLLNDSARESLTQLATKIEVCVCVWGGGDTYMGHSISIQQNLKRDVFRIARNLV